MEQLLQAPVMHVDETSFRVDKKNHWIHVYASGTITLKLLHRKRGKEAIEAIHIIPRYGGVIVHDCRASYLSSPSLKSWIYPVSTAVMDCAVPICCAN